MKKGMKQYWLMKSEPGAYSIDDLKKDKCTHWEGVRNYQARNYMRLMKKGDGVLFYHSNAHPPAVAGIAKVVKEAYPDVEQFNTKSKYFDPRATKEKPVWDVVDIAFVKKCKEPIPLGVLKSTNSLEGMVVTQKGSRLSIQPVLKKHFEIVEKMGS
ncbi:MAG: EVE domain-containing protein [bacterium]|nr:EVE domain-containing protein [bacterium]